MMQVAFTMVGGCPWETAVAVLELRAEGEILTMHGLKTWQSLATIAVKCPRLPV